MSASPVTFDPAMLHAVAQMTGAPVGEVADVVADAITTAYATTDNAIDGVRAHVDPTTGVVTLTDPAGVRVPATGVGARGTTAARQAIATWLKDRQRRAKVGPWADKEGTVIRGTVRAVGRDGEVRLSIDGTDAVLPAGEQVPGEALHKGQRVAVLLLAANLTDRDKVRLSVSRRQPALITALFREKIERDYPDAQVVSVAREPGRRAKVAVTAPGPDPRRAFIGPVGATARAVADDLGGEVLDIIAYHPDLETFVSAALSPAVVRTATLTDPARSVVAVEVEEWPGGAEEAELNRSLAARLTKARVELR